MQYCHFGAFRLLLATLVVLQHFLANVAPEPVAIATQPYEFGSVAVLVFFALSGFVICEAADQVYRARPGSFAANRALRIVPHYVAAALLAVAVHGVFEWLGTLRLPVHEVWDAQSALSGRNIALNVLGFLPLSNRFMAYNFLSAGWAVSVEVAFYFVLWLSLVVSSLFSRQRSTFLSLSRVELACAVLLVPAFALAMMGRAPAMLQFLPYFVFGGALYAWKVGRGLGPALVMLAALGGISFQFLSQSVLHPVVGFQRAVWSEFIVMAGLLGAMTALALLRFSRFRRLDQTLGDLTYPLYLYHGSVLILSLSLTAGYSYTCLIVSIIACYGLAAGLHVLIDPGLDRIRNSIRGRHVRHARPAPSAPAARLHDRLALAGDDDRP